MRNISISVAIWLEKIALRIKKKAAGSALDKFLEKYSLTDGKMKPKTDIRFNPYEGTNLILIDELIKSGEIKKNDEIWDIGCGAGIFLIYLASKGFQNLHGVEIDPILADLCRQNISNFEARSNRRFLVDVVNGNALELSIDDDSNCFYLFNTFYDKDTYLEWLQQIRESLSRKQRLIKIIILYPTVASMGAMRECKWLHEKGRVLSKSQICYQCMNFIIYESAKCI